MLGFAVPAVIAVLVVAVRTPRPLLGISARTVPAAVNGYALMFAPDAPKQVQITGSL